MGYHLSFSGIVTFKNADDLRAIAGTMPPGRMLIETDTPYLAPVPHRGERNEPADLTLSLDEICRIKGLGRDEAVAAIDENTRRLYGELVSSA